MQLCKMKNIKAIIFDLGGVIYNINYNKTIEELRKLGIANSELLYSQKGSLNYLMILKRVKLVIMTF